MGYFIKSINMKNFGMIREFNESSFAKINLIIGENGTGKTFLMKALYAAVRSLEVYKRGNNISSINDILSEKLRWTFQVDRLGDLVTKTTEEGLSFYIDIESDKPRENNVKMTYNLSKGASVKVGNVSPPDKGKEGNSVFIPAKEVLSLFSVILKSRDVDQSFGFDDTYYDLAKTLRISPLKGREYNEYVKTKEKATDMMGGEVDYDEVGGKWFYKNRNNQKFSIGATAEGVKKIAIIDRLLSNGYLNSDSIIFIDEIEDGIHPKALCDFFDLLELMVEEIPVQIFITSHSYFAIKKLRLIAMKEPGLVSCISLSKDGNDSKDYKDYKVEVCDLHDRMPENSIIDTSINLYDQEVEVVM